MIYYKFTDKEINELLKHLTIIMDTREKQSTHILEHFKKKNIPYKVQKIDTGDYGCMIPFNEETAKFGLRRDIYFNTYVERKNGVDEICGNILGDNRKRFENELIRSQGSRFVVFVEDLDFDRKLALHEYTSKLDPKAFKGTLESFQTKYNFEIRPVDKELMGYMIHHRFLYHARNFLKTSTF